MKFGLLTECYVRKGKSQTLAFKDMFAQADAAEELGMDAVWVVEHHFRPDSSVLSAPMAVLGAIASRTKRIRVGTAVQVLPLGNPVRLVEEAASVDQISEGRLDFGIGRSGITMSYEGYNIPYSESRPRFDETFEIILRAFTQTTFSYEGQYHSFRDVSISPGPLQKPHPPIYVAVSSPESFVEMGRRGFPILLWYMGSYFEAPLAEYFKAWSEAGHPADPEVQVRIPFYVAETETLAHEEPKESTFNSLRRTLREGKASGNQERIARAERLLKDYGEVLRTRVVYGSPESVVERLQEFKSRMGATGFLLDMNFGGQIPQERVLNSMRLLTEQVAPRFT